MRQMDVWLRWSASVSPASASWSAASATDGKESSVGNRGNVCFLLTSTYHGCPTQYLFGAPGVGASLATGVPLACAMVSAEVNVMPVPETCDDCGCLGATTLGDLEHHAAGCRNFPL